MSLRRQRPPLKFVIASPPGASVDAAEVERACRAAVCDAIALIFDAAARAAQTSSQLSTADVGSAQRTSHALLECLSGEFSFHGTRNKGVDWFHISFDRMSVCVSESLRNHVAATVMALLGPCIDDVPTTVLVSNTDCLRRISLTWNFVVAALQLVAHVLCNFDNCSRARDQGVETVGLMQVMATIRSRYSAVFDAATRGFLEAVAKDRVGDRTLWRDVPTFKFVAVEMGEFHPKLEAKLKAQAEQYFHALGNRLVHEEKLTVDQFVRRCEHELAAEQARAVDYGHGSTSVFENVAQERLIKPHISHVAKRGLKSLVQQRNYAISGSLYRLARLSSVREEAAIKAAFAEYVFQTATDIVAAPEGDEKVVDQLIEHNHSSNDFINNSLCSAAAEGFRIAKSEALERATRPKQHKCAALLAKYLDRYLANASGTVEADQIDEALNNAMDIFEYIPSKDVFEAFYVRDFGKRLILQRSIGLEHERVVIDRLRAVCGPSIAVKLNGMTSDMDLSRDIVALFKQTKHVRVKADGHVNGEAGAHPPRSDGGAGTSGGDGSADRPTPPAEAAVTTTTTVVLSHCGFEFNPTILTQGYWPTYPDFQPRLPGNVARQIQLFETFYRSKHSSRRLQWQYSLAHCVLTAVYGSVRKELVVSFLQALMLLQFNTVDEITYGGLLSALGVQSSEETTCAIIALTAGKARLLHHTKAVNGAETKGTRVSDSDKLTYNANFTHRLSKIRVNQVQLKETKQEAADTTEKVLLERHYAVDAAIVRFLKSRKQSTHAELVAGVLGMLRFVAQPSDVKKRVEVLIERDYLERDARDPSVYRYLA